MLLGMSLTWLLGVTLKAFGALVVVGAAIWLKNLAVRHFPEGKLKNVLLLRLYRADWERD